MSSDSAKKKLEVKSWQETVSACEHTLTLQQDQVSGFAARSSLQKCHKCNMTDNLWLCMTCGYVGCGRRQFDGSGGNGHAAEHFQSSAHGVSLKLGTISAEGTADIFCYACDEMRLDPRLQEHLALFNIMVGHSQKTEKSMAELQLEQNLKYDFSMATEDGKEYEAAPGAGLANLGNSCYLASVMQVCSFINEFKAAFGSASHFQTCTKDPASCFVCQMTKLQLAIQSCNHSIAPWMFKTVVSSGHAEFSSTQQQDAAEFFAYLLKVVQRNDAQSPALSPFKLTMQQSLSCKCGHQSFKSEDGQVLQLELAPCIMSSEDPLDPKVTLEKCIQKSFEPAILEVNCSKCDSKFMAKESYVTKLPEVLALPLSRYIIENWVPKKLDLAIGVPHNIDLSGFVRPAHPDTKEEEPKSIVQVDEEALQQLISMGFTEKKCRKALIETGNSGADMAMNWLFEHMEDPEPADEPARQEISPEMLDMLMSAGFSEAASRAALLATDLDVERAFDYALSHPEAVQQEEIHEPVVSEDLGRTKYELTAFISHKGPSIHCGHYVAYRKDSSGRWILCNDAKLAYVPDDKILDAASTAYIFFYHRI